MSRQVTLSAGTQVLRVSAVGGGFNLNWLQFASAGGANLALGKGASASSVNASYGAGNATDGSAASYWESASNAFPQQLTVDLGSAQSVSRVTLKLPAGWEPRQQTITVLGSADGAGYGTIVGGASYAFNPASGNSVTISFTATSRRYLRIQIGANTGWPAAQLAEVEIY